MSPVSLLERSEAECARPHGTPARYSHGPDHNDVPGRGCRCPGCTEAVRLLRRRQRNHPPQTVSSTQARHALNRLLSYGWTRAAVCRELGLTANPSNLLKYDRCTVRVADAVIGLEASIAEIRRCDYHHRYPLAPVLDECAARGYRTMSDAARFLGVDPSQLHRWRSLGIRLSTADRLACFLGRHPSFFWPDYFAAAAA